MPLTINVGLSKKSSRNYQSTGESINITAELDQALLAKPDELQRQVDELYQQAEHAIERQANSNSSHTQRPTQQHRRAAHNGRNYSNASNGKSQQSTAMMTHSQRRAIESISQRLGFDPVPEIDREFGWSFNELTLKTALKMPLPAGRSNGCKSLYFHRLLVARQGRVGLIGNLIPRGPGSGAWGVRG